MEQYLSQGLSQKDAMKQVAKIEAFPKGKYMPIIIIMEEYNGKYRTKSI